MAKNRSFDTYSQNVSFKSSDRCFKNEIGESSNKILTTPLEHEIFKRTTNNI
jgi:hypothetical protein